MKKPFRLTLTLAITLIMLFTLAGITQAALTVTNLTASASRYGAVVTGQITGTNGYNNCIYTTVYYGTTDGTNVAASWANSVATDQSCSTNGASLSATLGSLSPEGIRYYWRLYASETGDSGTATVWATSSGSFTTAITGSGIAGQIKIPGTTNILSIVVTNLPVLVPGGGTNTFKFLTTP